MTWKVKPSNKMLILGTILIIVGFGFMTLFSTFMSFSLNRLTMWLYVVLIGLVFELGLFSIFVVKTKEVVRALLASFIWSCILLIPVPQGYEEPIYGGSLIFLVAIMILYDKYKSREKKNTT